MPSDPELADIIQLGHDITSFKLYLISATALWFYDYFLTVNDEFRPGTFQRRTLYGQLLSHGLRATHLRCMRTAFIELMYAAFITVFAQIILSQRTYAITMKSKWIAGILYTVAAIQFGVGAYVFMISALHPGQYFYPTTHILGLLKEHVFSIIVSYTSFGLVSPMSFFCSKTLYNRSSVPLSRVCFRARHRADANHKSEEPRDEYAEYPQYRQQGRGDIFRSHIYVSFPSRAYVFCDEGRILLARTRIKRILTVRSASLAAGAGYSISVSCPNSYGRDG
ncbi:hypothetical protein BDM02DRAFT_3131952 [Thelephora ganbajun]|uniref:Uncharacterized protein n=1 Tax=Thelephora ganbajun TaxID=370292 RepID=A0ACB6Z350_THEGA|nr:hypothetical protein BDM02DRAFT_3131952 [Thelephora ganbajun]